MPSSKLCRLWRRFHVSGCHFKSRRSCHFHNTQQFAMLANLVAIPICNFLVMPAALAALVAMPFGLEAAPLRLMGLGIEAMVWCAQAVAALPGAVGRVPAIPTLAFALIVVGGLWCALWGTRWRLFGIVPIALGLMLAPSGRRPDVLVGRGGTLIAVRGPDGKLSALADRGTAYELARWLEHDGDGRTPAEAGKAGAFRCDRQGCTAEVKGLRLAVASSAAALRDDCTLAAILILKLPRPKGCRPAGTAIDIDAVKLRGAHALTIAGGKVDVETVADTRGERPWAPRIAAGELRPASGWSDDEQPARRRWRRPGPPRSGLHAPDKFDR
jgi:competence protein ComEC